MKERLIDSALLVGLVVVCIVILFVLFSPSTLSTRRSAEPTEPVVEQTLPIGEEGDPVIVSGGDTPPEGEAADESAPVVADEDLPEETATEAETQVATEEEPEVETQVEESTTPPPPLPEGAFDLERIGFSFAGATGACSVPLEAWRHVAVSRDILAEYPCGSEITITLDDPVAGRDSFEAIVGDTMNPSKVRTVNIYVAPDEPALEYGVAAGRLEP